jgi:hypothetical protein
LKVNAKQTDMNKYATLQLAMETHIGQEPVDEDPPFSTLMAISLGNAMEKSGKEYPKIGFKSPPSRDHRL